MGINNVGLVYKKNEEIVHDVSFRKVDDALERLSDRYGFLYRKILRDEMTSEFSNDKDFILVIAGDNNLASVIQMVRNSTPLLGINSDI